LLSGDGHNHGSSVLYCTLARLTRQLCCTVMEYGRSIQLIDYA